MRICLLCIAFSLDGSKDMPLWVAIPVLLYSIVFDTIDAIRILL